MDIRNFLKIQICICISLILSSEYCLATNTDKENIVAIPAVLTMSNDVTVLYDVGFPNNVVESFSKEDKIIFFFGQYRILYPAQDYYNVVIDCIDNNGTIIFKSKLKRKPTLNKESTHQQFGEFEVRLGLSPQNKYVSGQIHSLESGRNYLIRVYVEDVLISLTPFQYR